MSDSLKKTLQREIIGRGLSLRSIARACKIPESVLHGWVHGAKPSAKNLNHLVALSEYLQIPLSMLLFNKKEADCANALVYSSLFKDGDTTYRIFIEKVNLKRK